MVVVGGSVVVVVVDVVDVVVVVVVVEVVVVVGGGCVVVVVVVEVVVVGGWVVVDVVGAAVVVVVDVVGGGVVGGAVVGVHSSSDTCTVVTPSVTVTWQLLDRKLGASTRKSPSSSAALLADDSAEVTDTMAFGTASSPSTLSRPSSSSARSTKSGSSALTGTTNSETVMPASATAINPARLATRLLMVSPPATHRGHSPGSEHYDRSTAMDCDPLTFKSG